VIIIYNIEHEAFFFHGVLVEDSVLWRYDAMLVGNLFLTFRRNIVSLLSRVYEVLTLDP